MDICLCVLICNTDPFLLILALLVALYVCLFSTLALSGDFIDNNNNIIIF